MAESKGEFALLLLAVTNCDVIAMNNEIVGIIM